MTTTVYEAHRLRFGQLLLLGLLSFTLFSPAHATPSIEWTQTPGPVAVGVGQRTTAYASFTVSEALDGIHLWIAPELTPFVAVAPDSFAPLAAGSTQIVELTVSAPSGTPLGLYEGTLHLRNGNRTIARPLPIVVKVVWPTLNASQTLGVSLQYPPEWYVELGDNSVTIRNVGEPSPFGEPKLQEQSFLDIYRHAGANPDSLSVSEWFAKFSAAGLSVPILSEAPAIVASHSAWRVQLAELGGERIHLYIEDGTDIVEVSYGTFAPQFVPDYEGILNTLSIQH